MIARISLFSLYARHHFILLLLILCLNDGFVFSQTGSPVLKENIIFHRLTSEQGLPHDDITALLQDKKGFLWIGTANGFCRYDGTSFLNVDYINYFSHKVSQSPDGVRLGEFFKGGKAQKHF